MTTTYTMLVLLAMWRLARLITVDTITEPLRAWVAGGQDPHRVVQIERRPRLAYLFNCPWCMSIWLGPLVAVPVFWPTNRVILAVVLALAASGVAGLLVNIEDRIDR